MQLKKLTRNKKTIVFSAKFQLDGGKTEDRGNVKCPEAPKPELDEALQNLRPVISDWMDTTPAWSQEADVTGFTLTRTDQGTKSMTIRFSRGFSNMADGATMKYQTPVVRIDEPADGEEAKPLASRAHRKLVAEALKQAEEYVGGERLQMTLDEQLRVEEEPKEDKEKLL